MTITTIEDLTRHIMVDSSLMKKHKQNQNNDDMFGITDCTIIHEQGAWVEYPEVQELVEHLQSKLVNWHSASEHPELATGKNKSNPLIILTKSSGLQIATYYRGFFQVRVKAFSSEDVICWTYLYDLINTLPTENFGDD